MTCWKCPKCEIFNQLNENTQCSNTKEGLCKFDIQDGDLDPEFCELTENDLNTKNEEWKKKFQEKG